MIKVARISSLILPFLASGLLLSLTSCGSIYQTPSHPANLNKVNHSGVQSAKSARPSAKFPVTIVFASTFNDPDRGVEKGIDFSKLEQEQGIHRVISMNPLLRTPSTNSLDELRVMAAKTHADMVFVYRVDTHVESRELLRPLRILTLGLIRNEKLSADSIASGILIDVNTGFVYASYEKRLSKSGFADSVINSQGSLSLKTKIGREAFHQLVQEFSKDWPSLYERHRK